MLRLGDIIFSLDILEKKFCCDLPACMGHCCLYGDSGAPLSADEVKILDTIWPVVKPYMNIYGIRAVDELGTSVSDFENENVTPLVDNRECAYSIQEEGIYTCAIEKAWKDGKIEFRKPLSCHLFPARVKHFGSFTAVNYQELQVCAPAREKGEGKGVYLHEFLREPLERALGKHVYPELAAAALELKKRGKK
jgi:hypothetical protein